MTLDELLDRITDGLGERALRRDSPVQIIGHVMPNYFGDVHFDVRDVECRDGQLVIRGDQRIRG